MKRDSGQLPVDFLAGFTIFILSLIMVANYVPSLLVGLQRTSGIDYDAVAYRTGVVLVEDPGEPPGTSPIGIVPPPSYDPRPWDLRSRAEKEQILRLGLALTRDTPNILSINKIEKFFNASPPDDPLKGFFTDDDYRKKLLFSDYEYGYNITLSNISPTKPGEYPAGITRSIGSPYPAGYGYIRRYVVIKQNSNATIDMSLRPEFNATRENQVHQQFTIRMDGKILYNRSIDTHLKIDLQREPLSIKIMNLSSVLNNSECKSICNPSPIANSSDAILGWGANKDPLQRVPPSTATLKDIDFIDPATGMDWPYSIFKADIWVDRNLPGGFGHVDWTAVLPSIPVRDTIEITVEPLDATPFNEQRVLDLVLTFDDRDMDGTPIPHTLLTGTFWYDYNPKNVTHPVLSTGMLEVGIW